jgi:hypothetical protein
VLAALIIAGCGGSGGGTPAVTRVSPTLTINWDERTRQINAPASALSLRVTLDSPEPNVADVVWTINRGANQSAFTETYTSPTPVTAGAWTKRVDMFADENAQGAMVGNAALDVIVSNTGAFQTTAGAPLTTVSINRRVSSVTLTAPQVEEGQSVNLSAAALDAEGAVVPVTPGSFRFTLQAGSEFGSVTPTGLFSGTAVGRAQVQATVDGVSSSNLEIPVRPVIANYLRMIEGSFQDVEVDAPNNVAFMSSTNANTILRVNTITGATTTLVTLPFQPGPLAMSADGSVLYVGGRRSGVVARVSTTDGSIAWTVTLDQGPIQQFPIRAIELAVSPANPDVWAVVPGFIDTSPSSFGVRLFNGQTMIGSDIGMGNNISDLAFNTAGTELYSHNNETSLNDTRRYAVSATALTRVQTVTTLTDGFPANFSYANGKLAFSSGAVVNASNLTVESTIALPNQSVFRAKANIDRNRALVVRALDPVSLEQRELGTNTVIATFPVPSLIRWQVKSYPNGGFAVWDRDRVWLVRNIPLP